MVLLFSQMASITDARYGHKDASDQNFDYMFKLLIIGNSSVGKTSFLFRYADDTFTPAFVSTVGIDFKVKTVYRNDKRVKLQIWVSTSDSKIIKRVQKYSGGSRLSDPGSPYAYCSQIICLFAFYLNRLHFNLLVLSFQLLSIFVTCLYFIVNVV